MKTSASLASVLALAFSGAAFAQDTDPKNINVTAEVLEACSDLSVSDVDFGAASNTGQEQEIQSIINVTCGNGVDYSVQIDYGIAPLAGTPPIRRVTDGAGQFMDYYIFQPGGTTTAWGTTAEGEQFDGTGTGSEQDLTATFRLDRQAADPGTYTDLVTVSLDF